MKIAIDCRYLGKSGIGIVCEGILDNLDYSAHTFYLIGNPDKLKQYSGAKIIADESNPYSKKGLFKFQKKTVNHECDCLIIPNFLIPFGIKIPVYTVMHDLIFLDIKETTRGVIDRLIKKTLLKRCMKKSKKIACVSNFTKERCEYHFSKYAHKCYVNYNGLAKNLLEYGRVNHAVEKTNTVVFVGNVKPHKGLKTLVEAFSQLKDDTKLKIIGEREGFLTGFDLDISGYDNIEFTGRLDNEQLYAAVQSAKYLVQPSVYEGFGLPPLEALYLGTQPIISDIPVFREIYSDLPVKFFKDANDLSAKISEPPMQIDCRRKICERYSFKYFTDSLIGEIL